jgi:hypothetical protein
MGVKHHYQQHSNYVISRQVSLNDGENWSTLTDQVQTDKTLSHDHCRQRAPVRNAVIFRYKSIRHV